MDQELYEEDVKVVILPDRQEVTSDDLADMPEVVRERVRYLFIWQEKCYHSVKVLSGLSQWRLSLYNIRINWYSMTVLNIKLSLYRKQVKNCDCSH